MHRSILGAGLFATLAASAACPPPGAPIVERFTPADCTDCWAAAGPVERGAWVLDWIVPTTAGLEAPMAAAAPPEARERLLRSGAESHYAQQATVLRSVTRAQGTPRLEVSIGPAWYGYFALKLTVRGRLPAGASGWLALVEELPAGAEGNAAARELVRTVAGPLPLSTARPGQPFTHLGALRWPETARPERLHARGWIETSDGKMLALASDTCSRPRR